MVFNNQLFGMDIKSFPLTNPSKPRGVEALRFYIMFKKHFKTMQ